MSDVGDNDKRPGKPADEKALKPSSGEGIKETIESILVAFILAFVFRAFIVEAFVIPSGSMATTLLGAHMRFRCEECGYDYLLNYSAHRATNGNGQSSDDIVIPSQAGKGVVFSVHCPNCGQKASEEQAHNPNVHYGDRILVLKYLYLLQEPRRWDVVVFKTPSEPDYKQNYIKRMVGKPGERLMLLDGDVYVYNDQTGEWDVQAKPKSAQDALWRIVHDNDFVPRNSEARVRAGRKWVMPWRPAGGAGWTQSQPRIFHFANMNSSGTLRFDREANDASTRTTLPLTDWLPYDEAMRQASNDDNHSMDSYAKIPHWNVSDVRVSFFHQRTEGDGPLQVTLSKLDQQFTAELLPGGVRLLHRLPTGEVKLVGEAPMDLSKSAAHVEFMNVDYRVTLRINGRDVLRTTTADYRPNVPDLKRRHDQAMGMSGSDTEAFRALFPPPRVELTGSRQKSTVTHLSLWRDVYYTPLDGHLRRYPHGSPENPIHLHRRGKEIGSDGQPHEFDNEYFVLGDNSIWSADARTWNSRVLAEDGEDLYADSGCVPERFLLGKAFFVYWPAGFRPFTPTSPDLVPNFGGMRFIH